MSKIHCKTQQESRLFQEHCCHIDGKIRSFSVRKKEPLAAKGCPRSLVALKGHPSTWAAFGR